MSENSALQDKVILAVDDERDVLESVEELLDQSRVVKKTTFEDAADYLKTDSPDLAILDIMGVNGLALLDEAVAQGIPTVMLTAHAVNPDTLMSSIRKGAIAYLPKETLAELDELLEELLAAQAAGKPPWKLLFDRLGSYFDERFGPDWKAKDKTFWSDFSRNWEVGRGIQERLKHDKRLLDKGI